MFIIINHCWQYKPGYIILLQSPELKASLLTFKNWCCDQDMYLIYHGHVLTNLNKEGVKIYLVKQNMAIKYFSIFTTHLLRSDSGESVKKSIS